jgi:addiction module RelE/StbE family toxin
MRKSVREPLNKLQIGFTEEFNRQRKKAPKEIKIAFREALSLFVDNQMHPILRNHSLEKKLAGYRSINVTGDWRALFRIKKTSRQAIVTFHKLGTHSELYKK